ncbi:MAG: 2,3-bisphosphoglycerate-independent phosphoglycerate mutase [Candidatus Berkelbacteria bacterium]|nr:2,3-bisphosphoglycerate-independent phosphoglycerate mutase [Candidatus Berkelbacteria bacterium]
MKNCALIILDGYAISPEKEGNAVLLAKNQFTRDLVSRYPKALLKASGQEAGLPWGEVGNSEVGHTNIGLGRVVLQDLPQIDKSISENKIKDKQIIQDITNTLKANSSNLHIIGLASDGAVHCQINHIIALVDLFKERVIGKIVLHLIADGRDVAEKSIEKYLNEIKKILSEKVIIGSLSGRYFAMDRDKNWDRIQKAYNAILQKGEITASSAEEAIKLAYGRNETDEFISPATINSGLKTDLAKDVFIFANYRSDRAIQLTRAFVDPALKEIQKRQICPNFITMTTYDDNLGVKVIFSNIELNDTETNPLTNPLPQLISQGNLKQYHIAETEKFAHVTYFFAGGVKDPYPGQENKLYKSTKVKSHDLYLQMRAAEITKDVILNLAKGYNFIVINYANGDMVGHSGNLEATVKTVDVIDFCLSQLVPKLHEANYTVFLTADHGNCDEMIDLKSKKPNKEHTLNPVFFLMASPGGSGQYMNFEDFILSPPIGVLGDVAPTVLAHMGLEPSAEMTGMDLRQSLT